jgi:dihydroceramidase
MAQTELICVCAVYFALKYSGRPSREPSAIDRLDSLSVALLLVGVTSTAFHATLRQTPQFTDDISMLVLTGSLMQELYCHNQPRRLSRLIKAGIWLPTSIITLWYVRSGNLLIHMWTFGTMVAVIGLRLVHLIYVARMPEQKAARLRSLFWKGTAYLIIAFAVWNADLETCSQLRDLRHRVGLPWAWLLELHGWWHVLTAIGAARFIELVREICDHGAGRKRQNGSVGGAQRKHYAFPSLMLCSGMTNKSKADLDRIGACR